MSQTFHLHLATDTIASDAQQLGVSIDVLKDIRIVVSANIIKQPSIYLQLTYHINLPIQSLIEQLNWPTWRLEQVGFADYLWKETCLECFISSNAFNSSQIAENASSYIESNASPDGRYAFYQFSSYRNPSILPPIPRLQTDSQALAYIDWHDNSTQTIVPKQTTPSHSLSKRYKSGYFERSFKLPITQLSHYQYSAYNTVIRRIHPCVILCLGETLLYFASNHTTPPDFHNQNCWSKFEL